MGGEGSLFLNVVYFLVTVSSFLISSDTCVLLRKQACAVKVFQFNVKCTAMICVCSESSRYTNENV